MVDKIIKEAKRRHAKGEAAAQEMAKLDKELTTARKRVDEAKTKLVDKMKQTINKMEVSRANYVKQAELKIDNLNRLYQKEVEVKFFSGIL